MVIKSVHPLVELCAQAESIRYRLNNRLEEQIVSDIYANAEKITAKVVTRSSSKTSRGDWDSHLDDILTSRWLGYPIMIALLGVIFWITLKGANRPSDWIATVLFAFQDQLTAWFQLVRTPAWLHGVLVLGLYRALAWVVSVMLPPMAIFFPLFTLLEDLGYLPRVAFNLDNTLRKCKACGKQILTMCMGFGCNAAGVVACRIINSPRERLIAVLTNNFVPCNGRFPTLITIATLFIGSALAPNYPTLISAVVITVLVILGIGVTFAVSWALSHTILQGEPSFLVLELPPYRKPQIGAIIYRSIIDRTLFVLKRAVLMAAPAGALTWILGNVFVGELNIITHLANYLQPIGKVLGLDGFILLAFILGLPANEIVVPILLMSYLCSGQMVEFESLAELHKILLDHGWTWLTAVNMMLFCLLHWPCSTTLLSIYKETGSKKWVAIAFILPTIIACSVCFMVTQTVRFFQGF